MPVNFLSEEQRANYGRYPVELTKETLARYFHLDDFDRLNISEKRGEHNRLGFAILLCTVRYLGKFPESMASVPDTVIECLAQQLGVVSRNRPKFCQINFKPSSIASRSISFPSLLK
ncbi:DUF4158 domain-containing protein, partial [Xenorhabdus khoisanae]|uniref:DUF4158 domain-containing protein n=1 Tax=Xenorhabdus khoisanae TaxID=880157 RepID=UPI00235A03F5